MSAELAYAPQVLKFAEAEKISLDDLRDMLKRAARVTLKTANRRYHQYLFMVQDGVVTWAGKITHDTQEARILDNKVAKATIDESPPQPQRPEEFLVYEACGCGGEFGCTECGGKGEVAVIRRNIKPLFNAMESVNERSASPSRRKA